MWYFNCLFCTIFLNRHVLANSRYLVLALPLWALIIAAFVDWLWRQRWGVFYTVPIFLLLLMSNLLGFPYLHPNRFTGEEVRFYFSEKLIFCCALNEQSGIPKEKIRELGVPLFAGDVKPIWYVMVGGEKPNANEYKLVFASDRHSYPTQRPELEVHTFRPLHVSG